MPFSFGCVDRSVVLCAVAALLCSSVAVSAPIPVIFDTDIGTDFDDSVALAYTLSRPDKFDVKLVVSATGDTVGRAQLIAAYLTRYNRTDIPVGIGVSNPNGTRAHLFGWSQPHPLASYAGVVHQDGVAAMAAAVAACPQQVTILAIAPADNFPSLLQRFPEVVDNARIVAMSGSIHRGYNNATTPAAEYNVKVDPYATAVMYGAKWAGGVLTTPLDTCGTFEPTGDSYLNVLRSNTLVGTVLVESYTYWSARYMRNITTGDVWYDAVAAFLALDDEAPRVLDITDINVTVTPAGYTQVDPKGSLIRSALTWIGDGEQQTLSAMSTVLAGQAPQPVPAGP